VTLAPERAYRVFAFLQLSTVATLGFLCAAAGFLIILALVMFVLKGKAVLNEGGAVNALAWGTIKANLTPTVALFCLGGAMIALPFWQSQRAETRLDEVRSQQPATALLTGKINGSRARDVRMLLVVKPDYDQTYRGDIIWEFPLIARDRKSVV